MLTVIGTVLPFSTKGGTSSLTLPVRTTAVPTTSRIAPAIVAGVASAGRSVTIGTVPSTAALPAEARNWRRVAVFGLRIRFSLDHLFAQARKICHDILDLLCRQDRSPPP